MGSVTFKDVDFLDSRTIENAVRLLWAIHRHAKYSVELFGEPEEEVRERHEKHRTYSVRLDETLLDEEGKEVYAPVPTKIIPQGFYRGNTKDLIEKMLEKIEQNGSTTLEEVAREMSITLDTARAFLRNAGRTSRAHKAELPFLARWDVSRSRNEYTRRDA